MPEPESGTPPPFRIADLRKEYALAGLRRSDLDLDPTRQFRKWLQQALDAGVIEANTMTLATVSKSGQPSARTVLLKSVDERGFTFFTNCQSRKARELAENSAAGLVFYWKELERQVCVTGTAARVSREESEAYFKTRPRGNRLGAWASDQSQVIGSRDVLEERLRQLEKQYPDDNIPLPSYWGGYVVSPKQIEFWQGRPNRLHDRFRYLKAADGRWVIERLAP